MKEFNQTLNLKLPYVRKIVPCLDFHVEQKNKPSDCNDCRHECARLNILNAQYKFIDTNHKV